MNLTNFWATQHRRGSLTGQASREYQEIVVGEIVIVCSLVHY